MKASILDTIACPTCSADFQLAVRSRKGREILEGTLTCSQCGREYPVRGGIPRFVPDGAYARSFGHQWNWFKTVQLDSYNGTRRSETALREATGWTDDE